MGDMIQMSFFFFLFYFIVYILLFYDNQNLYFLYLSVMKLWSKNQKDNFVNIYLETIVNT